MNALVHEESYRGEKLMGKIANTAVVLCGAGAVGSNLCDSLCRMGFKKVSVIDYDRVELHNTSTQIWGRRDVGQLKTSALKTAIFNSTGVVITDVPKKLEPSKVDKLIKKDGSVVVDGFDNIEGRALIMDHCQSNNIECLHIGLAQNSSEITWNKDYRLPTKVKGLDVCEYPLARSIVIMTVAIATEVLVRFIDTGVRNSYIMTLGDFKVTLR
jgi:tRNA A37 threonylcarbamoyladenosine dehydratase